MNQVRNVGPGSGRIWLENIACTGMEESLNDCPALQWGESTCTHDSDVEIACTYSRNRQGITLFYCLCPFECLQLPRKHSIKGHRLI